jgi:hypothetical protein
MMEKMAAAAPAHAEPPPLCIGRPGEHVSCTPPPPAAATAQAQHKQAQDAKMAELEQAHVSPETGEIVGLPSSQASMFSIVSLVFEQLQHNHSPARYRAAAARAVLAARGH